MTHYLCCKRVQARSERAQLSMTEKRFRHRIFIVDHFKLALFTDLPFCSLKMLRLARVVSDLCNLIADS